MYLCCKSSDPRTRLHGIIVIQPLDIFFTNLGNLRYPLLHQLFSSDSPVKIGPAVSYSCRDKQTDKNLRTVYTYLLMHLVLLLFLYHKQTLQDM